MFKKLFKTYSEREITKIEKKYVKKIESLEQDMEALSDDELRNKTSEFKERLKKGETLDSLLPEAFAVCREASKRVLGMKHYKVQLIGGVVLHQGRVAEMKTGEGKTLVATLPAYLNALTEKGVYIVTVNDYLARRDKEMMSPLYNFLGISCEVITSDIGTLEKKELYKADIIYITNSELGFDYLKDNMVMDINDKVQREFNFAIIDEVDSILIDEARTPLIISKELDKPTNFYNIVDVFVQSLDKDDVQIDKKGKIATLTETGVEKAEFIFGLENYSDIEHNDLRHHIKQALHANHFMIKDVDYIVKNNQILIVDEFTGRIGENRRFSNGLHQAIEAKEGVPIKKENVTLATITYPNFFKMFKKLSGMTGTGITEQQEFNEIYNLDVVEIPTNMPIKRIDKEDKIYVNEKYKIDAIIEDIKECYKIGRPVLVGTPSIEKSEAISNILKAENIPHKVLNAKHHEQEAEIVSHAGELGSVTIATNMAGRGTDIKLGEGVKEIGGLKIIGTERASNRRIDNQLRGRAGRQGDDGESQFYSSFDDYLITFIPERYKDILKKVNQNKKEAIKDKILYKMMDSCQKSLEASHFETRKSLIKYDDVVNTQRILIYKQRDEVLKSDCIENIIFDMIDGLFNELIQNEIKTENDINSIINIFEPKYFDKGTIDRQMLENKSREEILTYLVELNKNIVLEKQKTLKEGFSPIMKNIILTTVDYAWQNNIEDLECLKRDVKLMSYKQIDPLNEFVMKSHELFNNMIFEIRSEIISTINKSNTY